MDPDRLFATTHAPPLQRGRARVPRRPAALYIAGLVRMQRCCCTLYRSCGAPTSADAAITRARCSHRHSEPNACYKLLARFLQRPPAHSASLSCCHFIALLLTLLLDDCQRARRQRRAPQGARADCGRCAPPFTRTCLTRGSQGCSGRLPAPVARAGSDCAIAQ
jgi:hypothetical protein